MIDDFIKITASVVSSYSLLVSNIFENMTGVYSVVVGVIAIVVFDESVNKMSDEAVDTVFKIKSLF